MSKRKQIGYSLSLWETLKEYNEETKWFEPIKNKKVEVAQMLSEELSDNEEVKSLLIDKMFGYKDDIKQLLKKGEYSDIPSYHKESLEKDQKIADLEAKLAEKQSEIQELNGMYEELLCAKGTEHELMQVSADCDFFAKENRELKQQLAEKDKEIENVTIRHLDMLKYFIRHNSKQGIILSSDLEREIKEIEQGEKIWQTKNFNQDKISFAVEQLEKVKETLNKTNKSGYIIQFRSMDDRLGFYKVINNQIEELKKEMK